MKIRFLHYLINLICRIKNLSLKPKISFLVFWVGTKCTLKCKLCCNLIPYIKQVSYDVDEIIEDLKFVVKNTEIDVLQIQGGEPFTHPHMAKIIDFVSNSNIKNVHICSNGTVALKKDAIEALKRSTNTYIRLSDYECTKVLREKFCKTLDENNINYVKYGFEDNNEEWYSSGGIDEKCSNDDETKETYHNCPNRVNRTLADGILSVCGKTIAIKEIYHNNKSKKYDEIDVRKIRKSMNPFKNITLRHELTNFIKNSYKYKEQCRYCRISDEGFPAAEQLSLKELTEADICKI